MDLSVLPIHKHPKYLLECCHLLNSEWKRSETARLRGLENSCDKLPVNLVLIKNDKVIGHAKISAIPSIRDACFIESVVIDKSLRGQGFGTYLMKKVEEYAVNVLKLLFVYLSTRGQEEFYRKLGYNECEPISIYGGVVLKNNFEKTFILNNKNCNTVCNNDVPKPPPLPKFNAVPDSCTRKTTFMCKYMN